jgi:hypothetical protein
VVPACSVYNYGTTGPGSYDVRMRIGAGYNRTTTVTNHPPGTAVCVTFPDWTATPPGTFAVTCSTELTGDQVGANDKATGTVDVVMSDIGAVAILAPAGTIPPGVVTPLATVHNYGTRRDAATVTFGIGPAYTETITLAAGVPFADTTISFPTWTAAAGSYATRCSTWMATDQYAANNVIGGSVTVSAGGGTGWVQKTPMPAGAKAIKDGGWLAYDVSKARIYASRGQKQPDFFVYVPVGDYWGARAPWLPGTEGKLPGKGSAGCADGNGIIYATKGNNKSGFYKYDANADVWTQLKDVPLGLSNKKVKGGTDIVWALKGGVGYPYLLKGYKNEFYRYDTGEDSWQTLAPAPVGSNQKWDKGSWLAYDGVSTIYAHKAKYHELWKYDTETDAWDPTALVAMPIPGSAGSKKSKDGGCGTYLGAAIYALKGGNTQEFWKYTVATNSWVEKETIPAVGVTGKKKKVKAGADIVALGTDLYATKGNKANELWMYTPGAFAAVPMPEREGVTSSSFLVPRSSFIVSPNPLASGFVVLRYGLPKAGVAWLRVYNVTGQTVMTQTLVAGRSGVVNVDLRHLSNGVYVVRFASEGFECSQKLVVQR